MWKGSTGQEECMGVAEVCERYCTSWRWCGLGCAGSAGQCLKSAAQIMDSACGSQHGSGRVWEGVPKV